MNDKELFKKIGLILSEISDQYRFLEQNPASLNEFELELMRANAKFLTDHAELLLRLYRNSPKPGLAVTGEYGRPETAEAGRPVIPDEKDQTAEPGLPPAPAGEPEAERDPGDDMPAGEDGSAAAQEEAPGPVTQDAGEPDEGREAPAAETVLQEKQEELPVAATGAEETRPVVPEVPIPEQTIAADEPLPAPKTVNELMGQARPAQATVGENMGRRTVSDLKSAISLNDKMLFVRELFNGYSLAYSEALDILNRSASFESATSFLETNYAGKNGWERKTDVRDKFYEAIRQRF